MPITHIHTFLVHPAKGNTEPTDIGGSTLKLSGKMFDLLKSVYDRSENECDVAISFNHSSSGAQQNDCRDLIVKYISKPDLVSGRSIAKRLAKNTDNRARLGLLFLIFGKEGQKFKFIISRFPADSGILAEQNGGSLNVEFLEKIFMKSARAYKAVLYLDSSFTSGFWVGHAIDKQINESDSSLSGYWINDFLNSDFRTTAAAGTRRLAVACKAAARKATDIETKKEIAAAITLAKGQNGRRITAREFVTQLGLSGAAQLAILTEMRPHLLDEKFQFSNIEFQSQAAYRSIELDNGAILTAEAESFEDVFGAEIINARRKIIKYTTQGIVVNAVVRKTVR